MKHECPYCHREFPLMASYVAHFVADRLAIERRGDNTLMFKSNPGDARKPNCLYEERVQEKRITWNRRMVA